MDFLLELFGRFHPLIIHLPIGIILFGAFIFLIDRRKNQYSGIIRLAFLTGGVTGIFSCISGFLLYQNEGYSYETVNQHLWMAIATTLLSFLLALRWGESASNFRNRLNKIPKFVYILLIFIAISITGHLGGNITHGSDYLTEPLPPSVKQFLAIRSENQKEINIPEENWESTILYSDVVEVILSNKCYSCHGEKQNKGELSLHTQEAIEAGGENGAVLIPGNTEESKIYQYLILPEDDDLHMPPKDKTQLEKHEIEIIRAWVEKGTSFEKSVAEIGLEKRFIAPFFNKEESNLPKVKVSAPDDKFVAFLKEKGFSIEFVNKNSNFLSIATYTFPAVTIEDLRELLPIAENIAYVNLSYSNLNDEVFSVLSEFANLTTVNLSNTNITGSNIEVLSGLENLQSVNFNFTDFHAEHVNKFAEFPALKTVSLFHTNVTGKSGEEMKEGLLIEYGNYQLPVRNSDTTNY